MKLVDKLLQNNILLPMVSSNKNEAIQELLSHLKLIDILSGTDKLFSKIQNQENKFTSSAGRGIAYPHSVSFEVKELTCILGVSHSGIDFNSPDNQNCHLILLTLSPLKDPNEHRKFITRFNLMLKNPDIRSKLFDSKNSLEIIEIITSWEDEDMQLKEFV